MLPLRPNVCIVLINSDKKIFLGERTGQSNTWQLPQGGVEDGLSLEENVIKELHEETGADENLFKIICKLETTHEYDFRNPPQYAIGKWRGQSQTFWLVQFIGQDCDINLDRFTPEFQGWQWCDIHKVLDITDPIRIAGYAPAIIEVSKILKS